MAERNVGAGKADSTREAIAERLRGAAGTIRDHANAGSEALADRAQSAAETLDASAKYIESFDARRMMQDLISVTKKYPAQSLAVAGLLGFLVGRILPRGGD